MKGEIGFSLDAALLVASAVSSGPDTASAACGRIYDDKFEAHVPSPKASGGLIKYNRGEWLALIKALVLGIEHFNFHGRVWKPMEYDNPGIPGFESAGNPTDAAWDEETAKGESFVADGQQLRHVHVTTAMTGGHAWKSKASRAPFACAEHAENRLC